MSVKKDTYNYGIAFTKVFLSFCVVCSHFWNPGDLAYYPVAMLNRMRGAAVPIFVLMAFFLTEKIFVDKNAPKIKIRVERLLVPYLSWPVLYFVGYRVIDVFLKHFGFSLRLGTGYTWRDLLWQLAFGHEKNLCGHLWYLFDLIVISVAVWILFKCCDKYSWHILILLGIAAVWLQYSGMNYSVFSQYIYEKRYPLGRLAEVFPLACAGLLLAHSNILEKMKRHRVYVVFLCIVTMLMIAYGNIFTSLEGFGYAGIYLVVYSTLAFICFYEFPFECMGNGIKAVLRFLSKYSLGVYCLHMGVGHCWNRIVCAVTGWRGYTLMGCMAIFAICLFVSWLISRIPVKYAKQLVE